MPDDHASLVALDLVFEAGQPGGSQRVADRINALDADGLSAVTRSLVTLAWTAAMKLVERGAYDSFDDLIDYWRAQVLDNGVPGA